MNVNPRYSLISNTATIQYAAVQLVPVMGCLQSRPEITAEGHRIKLRNKIAQGGFSEVFSADDIDSGDKYAVKMIIATGPEEVERTEWEISMHRLFSHPGIVPIVCSLCEEEKFYLVFPFYRSGTLYDELCRRRAKKDYGNQKEVIRIFKAICSAVHCIHAQGYAHRDLKTANFLFDEQRKPMLTDFGSSCKVPVTIQNSRDMQRMLDETAELCSMPYRAPELFSCEIGSTIGSEVDIWSLGCCLYALCYFISPFDLIFEQGNSIALASQNPHTITYPNTAPYDDRLVSLIRSLLVVSPSDRPTIVDVIQSIEEIDKGC